MRLQITTEELFNIAREYYNLPKGTEVTIVRDSDSSDVRDLRKHLDTVKEVFPCWRYADKIKAMLFLRKEYGYELADVRFIVENPDQAVENLRTLGRVRP